MPFWYLQRIFQILVINTHKNFMIRMYKTIAYLYNQLMRYDSYPALVQVAIRGYYSCLTKIDLKCFSLYISYNINCNILKTNYAKCYWSYTLIKKVTSQILLLSDHPSYMQCGIFSLTMCPSSFSWQITDSQRQEESIHTV